jgi:hypothetical protein
MEIPFKTTQDEILNLASIIECMKSEKLDSEFIVSAVKLASFDQGVYDLMMLWLNTSSLNERNEIIKDIEQSIFDYSRFA